MSTTQERLSSQQTVYYTEVSFKAANHCHQPTLVAEKLRRLFFRENKASTFVLLDYLASIAHSFRIVLTCACLTVQLLLFLGKFCKSKKLSKIDKNIF